MDIGNTLNELFNVFAEQLLKEVTTAKAAGIPIAAADKAAIIRFLQVNNMTYQPGQSNELDKLRELLLTKSQDKNKTTLAVLREAQDDLEKLYSGGTMQ